MRHWIGIGRMPGAACVVALALCAAACLGPRNYVERATYTLRPQPSVDKAPPTGLALGVRPLESAESIRDDIAYREEDFRLRYYEGARWAESPRDTMTRVVKDALTASGRFSDVGDARDMRPDLLLTGELREFEEVRAPEGRVALVSARLELRNIRDDRLVWADTLTSRMPVDGEGLGPLAAAMNRAVADIAERATVAIVGGTG